MLATTLSAKLFLKRVKSSWALLLLCRMPKTQADCLQANLILSPNLSIDVRIFKASMSLVLIRGRITSPGDNKLKDRAG